MNIRKNAVVVIVIDKSPEWDVCKPSVLKYCKKYKLHLEVITQNKYKIDLFNNPSNNFNLFEKNQIYELFNKYNRILRIDYDTIITPNCPNLFKIVPKDMIGCVYENVNRKERIKNIQKHLGDLNWKSGYMNAGVVIASKQHKEVFNTTIEEIINIHKIDNISMLEQDYLNYMIIKLGFDVYKLSYKFNHIKYFSQNRFESYIIHYAGSKVFDKDLKMKRHKNNKGLWKELTVEQMKRDYNVLY